MRYELLAIDVDGTLIGADQLVTADVKAAVAAAGRAGLRVCLATGRSLAETLPVWRQLPLSPPYQPLVVVGGAMVCEPDLGRTLFQRTVPRQAAFDFADELARENLPAFAFVDAWRHGVDYYCAEHGQAELAQREWFSKMRVKVRRVSRLRDDPLAPEPARISTVADPGRACLLADRLAEQFRGVLHVHAIVAPNYGVTVVEAFSVQADKFKAVTYVAQSHVIPPARMAAVGDDINDLSMIRGAGLGVTFPHAPPAVREAADHVAKDGLAAFIHQLVDGRFDE